MDTVSAGAKVTARQHEERVRALTDQVDNRMLEANARLEETRVEFSAKLARQTQSMQ